MTPQEKAEELIEQFGKKQRETMLYGYNELAKQRALIAVEEIIIALKFTNDSKWYVEQHQYWQQVKEEIENL